MAVNGIPWRVKTRPCPFYSQGRCLFADSCNFMHNVKITASPTPLAHDQVHAEGGYLEDLPRPLEDNATTQLSKVVDPVHSPPTILDSPRSVRSPRRSPRLSGLLFALQDVIGPDENKQDEEDEGFEEEDEVASAPNEPGFCHSGDSVSGHTLPSSLTGEQFEIAPRFDSELDARGSGTFGFNLNVPQPSPGFLDVSLNPSSADVSSLSFLSDFPAPPVSLPSQDPPLFSTPTRSSSRSSKSRSLSNTSAPRSESFDSGYADAWNSPPIPPMTPPRSAGPNSTFHLLSSPFLSPLSRLMSPRFSAAGCPPSPIFNAFAGPAQAGKASPPRTPQHDTSLHQDLDSPSEWHRPTEFRLESEAILSPQRLHTGDLNGQNSATGVGQLQVRDNGLTPTKTILNTSSDFIQADLTITAVTEYDGSFDASLSSLSASPSPSTRDRRASSSLDTGQVPYFASEVRGGIEQTPMDPEALDRRASNPIFNCSNPFFSSRERVFVDDGQDSPLSSPSSAPPASPTLRIRRASSPHDNEAVASMFRYYSEPSLASSSTINSSQSSDTLVEVEEAKQGVEVPMPVGSVSVKASTIEPAPQMPPQSVVPPSPPPPPSRDERRLSVASSSANSQTAESSKKVPFGFRQSFVLGESSTSSLMKSRLNRERVAKRTLPPVITDFSRADRSDVEHISSHLSPSNDPPLPTPSWMKPLRLSHAISSPTRSVLSHSLSSAPRHAIHLTNVSEFMQAVTSSHSPSVSSEHSLYDNRLFSSTRSSLIPEHIRNTLIPAHAISPLQLASDYGTTSSAETFIRSAPPVGNRSWVESRRSTLLSQSYDHRSSGLLSCLSEPMRGFTIGEHGEESESDSDDNDDEDACHTYRLSTVAPARLSTISHASRVASILRPESAMRSPIHAVATARPTLMFAIASDDVAEVQRVLESGEAGPNDQVGPQSALAFAVTNDRLVHKTEIVKALLAYGADPSSLSNPQVNPARQSKHLGAEPKAEQIEDTLNPAMKYYVARANAAHVRQPAALIQGTPFRPLSRIRFDIVGQDRALEQLYRVLGMHSQQTMINPLVVLCCGPSGHGKSLLARKFGHLLGVPTHTVNMTTLQSTHELWQSHSMSPYEEPSSLTLAEFLMENEGKRCVVVLDEIEKCENERNLWSLLAPWELGRCTVDAGRRHIDVRKVIWIGTSNIGQDLVFEYHDSRDDPEATMSRQEYLELMALLRPRVSAHLGTSLLSRVTTVLPFVPFTQDEKMAIASEALLSLGGDILSGLSADVQAGVVGRAVSDYLPAEGVRSLHRAVSTQLLDVI